MHSSLKHNPLKLSNQGFVGNMFKIFLYICPLCFYQTPEVNLVYVFVFVLKLYSHNDMTNVIIYPTLFDIVLVHMNIANYICETFMLLCCLSHICDIVYIAQHFLQNSV